MILLSSGALLKSVLCHKHLSYLHSSKGSTHLRRDTNQWQLNFGNSDFDDKLVIIFFCSLMKIYQNDSNDRSTTEKTLSILQSISTIEIHFHDLSLTGLTEEFMESMKMNSTVKFVDMYNCKTSDRLLQIFKAITCCVSLEQLHLQLLGSNKCPSFNGIFDTLLTNTSLKDLTFSLSSSIDLSAIILEFNRNFKLPCDVKLKFSDVSICRSKDDASWSVDLSRAGNAIQSHMDAFGCIVDALHFVQEKQSLNVSFQFSESIRSLDLAMADINTQLAILQSVIGKNTLKHLNLIESKLFVDQRVDSGIIQKLLLHPSHLEHMDMSLCSIDNTVCGHFAEGLKCNTSLKVLRLASNKIQGEGALKIFKVLIGNSTLVELDLSFNEELTRGENKNLPEAIQDLLQTENSSLKYLNLGFCNVTDEVCYGIASGLRGNTTLKMLDLQSSSFTHESVTEMLKSCSNIEELNLSMNKQLILTESSELGDKFEQLVKTSTCLRILKLYGSVNDLIVSKIVSGMKFNKSLEILNVDQCQLNAKTVADLVARCEYESFIELFVSGVKCTWTYYADLDWDKGYHWTVENHDSTHYHSHVLFYLLILSSEYGQLRAIGQRAYRVLCSLSNLDISNCNMSSSQFFSALVSLSILPNLVELNLSRNKYLTDNNVEISAAVCTGLKELLLKKRIEALNISCTGIHPQSWQCLFTGLTSSESSLKVLDISGNSVGQEGSAALILMLSTFGSLIELNISDCAIPNEFFSDELVIFLRPPKTLMLNCDQCQLDTLELKSSDAALEVSCTDSYAWWHYR